MRAMLVVLMMLSISSVEAVSLKSMIRDGESLIVADKTSGKIYVYDEGLKRVEYAPALYGRSLANSISDINSAPVTPSGEFRTRKVYSTQLGESITTFIEGETSILAIHPVWLKSPKQRRLERLASDDAADNRITNGCINVPKKFYYDIMNKLDDGVKLVVLAEGVVLENDIGKDVLQKEDSGGFSGKSGLN